MIERRSIEEGTERGGDEKEVAVRRATCTF